MRFLAKLYVSQQNNNFLNELSFLDKFFTFLNPSSVSPDSHTTKAKIQLEKKGSQLDS